MLNYLIDGIPMVYSGNELACTAKLNMFANRFYMGVYEVTDRENKNSIESIRRQEVIKALNKMKSESDLLRYGKTLWLDSVDSDDMISFKRVLGQNEIVFFGNCRSIDIDIDVKNVIINKKCVLSNNINIVDGKLHLVSYGYAVFQ